MRETALENEESNARVETRAGFQRGNAGVGRFEWISFGLFAILLALMISHHEMWRDELQAWLIALNTHSLPQLVHALGYEGHPALWYLLLWIPSHFSPNPFGMVVVNFIIALATAWVIVSAVKLPRPVRVLLVFSYFVFYRYGVTARSYELAMLLLLGAACCLVGERRRPWLAVLLLALSINTHVFAAPVAIVLAFWAFYLAKLRTWKDAGRMLLDREFLIAFFVLMVSGVISLATVWPAKDISGVYSVQRTVADNFKASLLMNWQTFAPRLPGPVRIMFNREISSLLFNCTLSVLMLVLVTSLFRTVAARGFFLACALLEIVFIAVTIGWPETYHLGLIFCAFMIALLIDAYTAPGERGLPWMPRKVAWFVIYGLLSVQVLCAADASGLDWMRPYSCAKEVSLWLKTNHLEKNPLVLQPSNFAIGIVAYLERPSAYYPSCRCFGSYEVRNTSSRPKRKATVEDMKIARGSSPLPVILISNEKLNPDYRRSLGLVELYETQKNAVDDDEIFYVYEQLHPPA